MLPLPKPYFEAKAVIATTTGAKYVTQLAKHWSHRFAVESTDDETIVPFSDVALCRLIADADGICARIEATEQAAAERLQGVVFEHIARFAFRETLNAPDWILTKVG